MLFPSALPSSPSPHFSPLSFLSISFWRRGGKGKNSSHKESNTWPGGRGETDKPANMCKKASPPNQKHREAYTNQNPHKPAGNDYFRISSLKPNLNVKINVCEAAICMEHIFQMFHSTTVCTEKPSPQESGCRSHSLQLLSPFHS